MQNAHGRCRSRGRIERAHRSLENRIERGFPQRPHASSFNALDTRNSGHSHRVDLIVEDKVVVEVKSVESVAPVCKAQVLTYMRVTGKTAGLLINFNMPKLMDGVKRLINPTYKL